MNTPTCKIIALTAALVGLIFQVNLKAQTLTLPFTLTQSSPAVSFGIDSNGVLSETAPLNNNFTTYSYTFSGSNPQLLWLPAFNAFRVGIFSGTQMIGQSSVAFALGTASAPYSFAMGPSTASGNVSFARGVSSSAIGNCSTAMGVFAIASGQSSTALGGGTAAGSNSTVLGGGTANGAYSTASGSGATANSYGCFTIGQYNIGKNESMGLTNLTTWLSADPVFEIGNGSSTSTSDAFVVFKDGNAQFSGSVKIPQSGDIPMYTGN